MAGEGEKKRERERERERERCILFVDFHISMKQ
jgi:hypothetical protein